MRLPDPDRTMHDAPLAQQVLDDHAQMSDRDERRDRQRTCPEPDQSAANQSQQRLKRFLVLLEPLTILAISVVLGGIMISVMLAITSLTNVL